MNEKEKKAIKWLKELYDIEKDFNSSAGKEESNIIKTLLNLIDKQQKEIEEQKENYKKLQNTEAVQDFYISKNKIRKIIEYLKKCTSKTDKRVNLLDYMIIGETKRATGRFINLDFIEKVLLEESGYELELLGE